MKEQPRVFQVWPLFLDTHQTVSQGIHIVGNPTIVGGKIQLGWKDGMLDCIDKRFQPMQYFIGFTSPESTRNHLLGRKD